MKKLFYPDFIFDSVFETDYDKLKELGIRGLAFDIDNTLCVYTEKPDQKVKALFDSLRSKGFEPFIISNGKEERVAGICRYLGCRYRAGSLKPFCFGYGSLLKELHLSKEECAFIGDQLFTDVAGGNLHHGVSVYVEPISREVDEKITVWKRPLEAKLLEKMHKRAK